jgi:hypothetical protein
LEADEIDVAGRAPAVVRGEEDSALEDEPLGVGRAGEPFEEPFRAYS